MADNQLDQFTQGYIECALWASTDEYCEVCGKPCATSEPCEACGDGKGISESMDNGYHLSDIHPDTLTKMVADCQDFQTANEEVLTQWYEYRDSAHSGHDFWLTRNRHGAGFWDRFSDNHEAHAIGLRLTDAAHGYGSFDLYIGDDDLVHGQ